MSKSSEGENTGRKLSIDQAEMIAFLIDRKLELPVREIFANLTPDEFEEAELVAFQRNDLEAKYASLIPAELKNVYERERAKLESEIAILFVPLSPTQTHMWASKDAWTLEEALALWVGLIPNASIRRWSMKNQTHDYARDFNARTDLASRALAAGKLSDPVEPIRFLNWANTKIPVFSELQKKLLKDASISPDSLSAELTAARSKIAELEAVIKEYKLQDKPTYKMAHQLFAIAAKANYNFKVEASRNTATAAITSAAIAKGLDIDDKTVLKYIDQGLEMLGEARNKKRKKAPS